MDEFFSKSVLELDILKETINVLKKDPGINKDKVE